MASQASVATFLVSRLKQWGVRRIFGYPGDGINGIMAALNEEEGQGMEFVQTRHEELAAFMACAHAKYTGEVGVCLATSGPGAIHLLNGLYDARLDRQPVLAIVGQQKRASLGTDYQQEVDLLSLFKDVAGEYVQMASDASQVRHLVDRAMRIAREERRVTCLIFPSDVQDLDAVPMPPRAHGSTFSGIGTVARATVPPLAALQQAADILNAGKRVAILAGAGAAGAGKSLLQAAELMGAGIAKALLGKPVLPDDAPGVTGCIGMIGTEPSLHLMSHCDTLLMVGSGFPYAEFLPPPGQARGVQIDIDARRLGLRYPMECNLAGDAGATLEALLPLLQAKKDRSWRRDIEGQVKRWWEDLERRAMQDADPVNPRRVFLELSPRLPADVILAGDSGSATSGYALYLKLKEGMLASLSGTLASMGSGLPYAIAAKLAYPGRPVIALAGDGAMQMNGINALITIASRWRQWQDPRLVVLVLNNSDLNFVSFEQRGMRGEPKFSAAQDLPDIPYAGFAQSLGLGGLRVDHPEQVGAAWEQALSADRPFLLEVVTDRNISPMAPQLTRQQAQAYFQAIARGDPEADALRLALQHDA